MVTKPTKPDFTSTMRSFKQRRSPAYVLAAGLGAAALAVTALGSASAQTPDFEIVAAWNHLPFIFEDEAAEQAYWADETHRQVLMQGIKLDSAGTIYVSTARWGGADVPATLSRLVEGDDGWVLEPYPSKEMNEAGDPASLQAVLGFEIDRNDVMWILDQGHIAGQPSEPGAEKLVLWDIAENREIHRYEFTEEDSDRTCSFLNDIVVDNDTGFAYITDSGIFCDPLDGGLIVYDSNSGTARRVLDATVFTNDQAGFVFRIDNRSVLAEAPMRTGADGIALSGDGSTLYWTNLTGNRLYALDTALLRDFETPEHVLRTAVREVAVLPSNTDGMTADNDGNLYMTGLMLNGLMYMDAETGEVSSFFVHPDMVWPDSLAWGPDGSLYAVSNHLHHWVDGVMDFDDPDHMNFRIWRFPIGGESYLQP